MNKFVKGFGMVAIAVGIMGACSQEVEPVKENISAEVKEEVKEEKTSVQLGETLNVDGVNITITNIEKFNGEINPYSPLSQDHAVKVDVIVENTNKESTYIDSTEFKMYDAEDFEITHALPSDEMELSAEIPGGKKVQGSLFFDVPVQSGTWEVHYESMASFNGEPAIWEVPAK